MQSILFFIISQPNICFGADSELLAKLDLEDFGLILRERRLRWFGNAEHSSGAVRTACDIQVDASRGHNFFSF